MNLFMRNQNDNLIWIGLHVIVALLPDSREIFANLFSEINLYNLKLSYKTSHRSLLKIDENKNIHISLIITIYFAFYQSICQYGLLVWGGVKENNNTTQKIISSSTYFNQMPTLNKKNIHGGLSACKRILNLVTFLSTTVNSLLHHKLRLKGVRLNVTLLSASTFTETVTTPNKCRFWKSYVELYFVRSVSFVGHTTGYNSLSISVLDFRMNDKA
ncbi:Uncharacterized protein FWK35_00016459, partial [Aphis craccivora]